MNLNYTIYIYFIILIFVSIIIYFVIPFILTFFLKKSFSKKINASKQIFVTFDDGPDPEYTPRVLNLLNEYDIKATFFLLGKKVEKHPEVVERILNNGHDIGDHSYEHHHAWKSNPFEYFFDLVRGHKALNPFLKDKKYNIFRPPYGKLNIFTIFYIMIYRKQVIFWTLDPKDYNTGSDQEITDFVLKGISMGSVLLLHDSRINSNLNSVDVTIKALKNIFERTHDKSNYCKISEKFYS